VNAVRVFWASTVGKKIVMAVTGLIGVGFVVGHMLGNLQVFLGPAKFNAYSHFLRSLGELLWLVRAVLLAAVVLHVVAAVQLSRRRLVARPVGYKRGSEREVSTFASRTIRWGGALLLVFIVFHILHFTTRSIFRDYSSAAPWSAAAGATGAVAPRAANGSPDGRRGFWALYVLRRMPGGVPQADLDRHDRADEPRLSARNAHRRSGAQRRRRGRLIGC
jgi:hypothetical protein